MAVKGQRIKTGCPWRLDDGHDPSWADLIVAEPEMLDRAQASGVGQHTRRCIIEPIVTQTQSLHGSQQIALAEQVYASCLEAMMTKLQGSPCSRHPQRASHDSYSSQDFSR